MFTDEDTVRRRIYKDGDEKLYLHDVFRRYIAETDGRTLLSKIPVTETISFCLVIITVVQGIVRCASPHLTIFIRRNEVLKCQNIQMRISEI